VKNTKGADPRRPLAALLVAGLAVSGGGAFPSQAADEPGAASPAPRADARIRKKLIAAGWDHVDARRLRENLAEMEKRPFDGVVIEVTGEAAPGKPCAMRAAFGRGKWEGGWFASSLADLKACRSARLTDNFVLLGAKPGEVYAVGAWMKVRGKGRAWLRVRWQTADGKWTAESLDRILAPGRAPAGEWGEAAGIADVPPGAGRIVLLLGIAGRPTRPAFAGAGRYPSADDAAWFDDAAVVRIE
jgi:hypothetical protein